MAERPKQGPGEHWEKKRGTENPLLQLSDSKGERLLH
jgi:hypothetical protein